MADLTQGNYQNLLGEYLRNNGQLHLLTESSHLALALPESKRRSLIPRLRKRFWRYCNRLERIILKKDTANYWIPGRNPPLLQLGETTLKRESPVDIAVYMHVYFLDLLPELLYKVQNVGQPFSCYITTDNQNKAGAIRAMTAQHHLIKSSTVLVTPNRGRDIAPWIVEMAPFNDRHQLWCRIHTKKSLHVPALGDQWRRFLLDHVLGTKHSVRTILSAFAQEPGLGIVIPPFYSPAVSRPFNEWDSYSKAKQFFTRIGMSKPPRHPVFSAGSMFWYRPEALSPLLKSGLTYNNFESEKNQLEGTLAHLVERSLVYIAKNAGFGFKVVLRDKSS